MEFALPLLQKFALNTASDTIKAQAYFIDQESLFPMELRREYCKNVVRKQKEFGLSPHEKLAAYAEDKIDPNKLNLSISMRKELMKDPQGVKELDDLVKSAESGDSLVSNLIRLDRKYGLEGHWGSKISNPITGVTEDPGPKPILWEQDGECATETQIDQLSKNWELLRDIFTPEFIENFKSNGSKALPLLGDYEKVLLLRMARQTHASNQYFV